MLRSNLAKSLTTGRPFWGGQWSKFWGGQNIPWPPHSNFWGGHGPPGPPGSATPGKLVKQGFKLAALRNKFIKFYKSRLNVWGKYGVDIYDEFMMMFENLIS